MDCANRERTQIFTLLCPLAYVFDSVRGVFFLFIFFFKLGSNCNAMRMKPFHCLLHPFHLHAIPRELNHFKLQLPLLEACSTIEAITICVMH